MERTAQTRVGQVHLGVYGCWVMDDDGNLDYVLEEEYTEELAERTEEKRRA